MPMPGGCGLKSGTNHRGKISSPRASARSSAPPRAWVLGMCRRITYLDGRADSPRQKIGRGGTENSRRFAEGKSPCSYKALRVSGPLAIWWAELSGNPSAAPSAAFGGEKGLFRADCLASTGGSWHANFLLKGFKPLARKDDSGPTNSCAQARPTGILCTTIVSLCNTNCRLVVLLILMFHLNRDVVDAVIIFEHHFQIFVELLSLQQSRILIYDNMTG
jgi:hypothetical protein